MANKGKPNNKVAAKPANKAAINKGKKAAPVAITPAKVQSIKKTIAQVKKATPAAKKPQGKGKKAPVVVEESEEDEDEDDEDEDDEDDSDMEDDDEDSEDDEDDEDEDDSEEEAPAPKAKAAKQGGKLKNVKEETDDEEEDEDEDDSEDDEDEDDEDEDEDDSEDDDEDEDEEPVKPAKKLKNEAGKAVEVKPAGSQLDKKNKNDKELEARTLFLKNLPDKVTEEEIKALHPGIQSLRIKESKKVSQKNKKKGKTFQFAFIEFATTEATTKAFDELQHQKIRDKDITVDYIGDRSEYIKKEQKKKTEEKKEKDMKRLHIGGFDKSATVETLKKLFPGNVEFTMPIKKATDQNMGFAFADYATEEAAAKVLATTHEKKFSNAILNVDYAFVRHVREKKVADKKATKVETAAVSKKTAAAAVAPAKKGKKAPVVEESEDDEDEDEDDDDEDEDDEDEDDDDEDEDDSEDDDEDEDDE